MKYVTFFNRHMFLFLLCCVVLTGVILRFYKFSQPIADWHSWRQVDTAAVARNFALLGFDPLRPKYDDLSNIQSGKDNPQGFRMVEFPLYQSIAYIFWRVIGIISMENSLRLVSIFASAGSIVCIGLLVKRIHTPMSALFAAMAYAILPYGVYYGRSILPEPMMVFLSLFAVVLTLAGFDKAGLQKYLYLLMGAVMCSLALLVKPFAVFLLVPIAFLYLKQIFNPRLALFGLLCAAISILPLYVWRQWIMQFPEGIPVSSWLFNEGNIRFKGAWFHWLFAERIGKLILGYWGIGFVALAAFTQLKKKVGLVSLFLLGSMAYLVIIARGNVQHDYYQQIIYPVICILVGLGASHFFEQQSFFQRLKNSIFFGILLLFTLAFSWFEVRGFYWINRPEIVAAGKAADTLLPRDAKVIAPYNGDTTFLYQTGRQGWPIGFEIEKKIEQGATHYVTVSPTDADYETKTLAETYTVLVRNEMFAIIDLTHKRGDK